MGSCFRPLLFRVSPKVTKHRWKILFLPWSNEGRCFWATSTVNSVLMIVTQKEYCACYPATWYYKYIFIFSYCACAIKQVKFPFSSLVALSAIFSRPRKYRRAWIFWDSLLRLFDLHSPFTFQESSNWLPLLMIKIFSRLFCAAWIVMVIGTYA